MHVVVVLGYYSKLAQREENINFFIQRSKFVKI